MGLFAKFKAGLQKTHSKLAHEIKRIVTRSPKLDAASLEELEAALIAADLGMDMTAQIVGAVKKDYETQGSAGRDVFAVAQREVAEEPVLEPARTAARPGWADRRFDRRRQRHGQDHHRAKLAHLVQSRGETALLAACDTFRAAAIEQLKLWGQRLKVEVIAGAYGADAGVGGARRRHGRAGAQGALPVH